MEEVIGKKRTVKVSLPPLACPGSHMKGSHIFANWVVQGIVMAGAYPGAKVGHKHEETIHTAIIKGILDAGITTFVCLQEEEELQKFLPYKEIASSFVENLHFLHLPITDLGIVKDDKVCELVEQLVERIEAGQKLYIHCWGGHGRTGVIVACLLARLYGLDATEALDCTQKFHDCREKPGDCMSPQTNQQREQVMRVVQLYNRKD